MRIIAGEDLRLLPLRGVESVFALQPGTVEDEGVFHVRGSRPDEIGYYVDGAAVRNAVTGAAAVVAIDEALAEIQLQAGGFNAEYGGANAGILLQELRTGAPEWRIGLLLESDNFTSDHEKRLGAYSYGYGNQVLTLSGPVAGNRKIRAFAAVQRRVQDSAPVFWDGFSSTDLVDSGSRGGSVHWASPDAPDSVDLVLGAGNIEHTGSERLDFNGSLHFDYFPFQLRLTGLYTGEDRELNPAPVRNMLNLARLPESERSASLLNLKGVHFLDANTFYELNLSFYSQEQQIFDPLFKDDFMLYNDSLAVAQAGADFAS